ncbi:MAG: tetratricopeptide repeat protein, partial [Planctomycetota bacterium]
MRAIPIFTAILVAAACAWAQEEAQTPAQAYEAGDFAKARELAEQAPDAADAKYWLMRLQIREFQKRRGVPAVRMVGGQVTVDPVPSAPEGIGKDAGGKPFAKGFLALLGGRYEDAIKDFAAVPKNEPASWEAQFYTGVAHYLNGAFDKAEKSLKSVKKKDPELVLPVRIRTLIAVSLLRNREGKASEKHYTQPIKACAGLEGDIAMVLETEALVCWGKALFQVGKDPEKKYRKAIGLVKDLAGPDACSVLGDAFMALAEYRRNVGKLDPKKPKEYAQAIETYGRGSRLLRRAEAFLGRYHYQQSRDMADARDLENARKDYEEALKRHPDSALAAIGLASTTGMIERAAGGKDDEKVRAAHKKELAELGKLAEKHPGSVPVLLALGSAQWSHAKFRMDRGEESTEHFEASIKIYYRTTEIDPKNGYACQRRARALQSWGLWLDGQGADATPFLQAAITSLNMAIEVNPKDAMAFYTRGRTRQNQAAVDADAGRDPMPGYAAALKDCGTAVLINPKLAQAYLCRALIHQNYGDWELVHGKNPMKHLKNALKECDRALKVNPKMEDVWMRRATINRMEGQWLADHGDPTKAFRAAIADYTKALYINPRMSVSLRRRGRSHQWLGDWMQKKGRDAKKEFEAAKENFDKALEIDPLDAWALYFRGVALVSLGRNKEAI